jgi:hypothetical protein
MMYLIVCAGLANVVAALAQHAPGVAAGKGISSSSILPMATAEDLAAWQRLDDVIMVRGCWRQVLYAYL